MIDRALLADTHALVWYFEGRLAPPVARLFDGALETGVLCGASVSIREVAVLVTGRRLRGYTDVGAWARRARGLGLAWLPLDEDVALESAGLPGAPPADPFDQIIIATARIHGLTLATRDGEILEYARSGHVRVLEA